MTDETRLSGTYGSDIDPLDDDYEFEDDLNEVGDLSNDIDYDFEKDEPLLWQDEIEYDDVTVDFPF